MWAKKEVSYMNFNDLRRNDRVEKILEDFTALPSGSIPESCKSNAATKGAYRCLANPDIETQEIRNGHRKATINRMEEYPKSTVFLFSSDATKFVYTGRNMSGIGVLINCRARGLNLHSTLVTTEDELVLGVIDQTFWGRKAEEYGKSANRKSLPIEKKETYFWILHLASAIACLPDDAIGIFVGDRAADIYEMFIQPCPSTMFLLIRARHNRKLAEDSTKKIFDELGTSPSIGTMEVVIPRSGSRKKRTAQLEIRCKKVALKPPEGKKNLPPVTINIISAREVISDSSTENQIFWKLVTTLSIDSLKEAIYAVATYSKRWIIERFHYTLKEGCKIEELQFESSERVDKAVALYTIVACRIMYMTYLARVDPDEPCTLILQEDEWQALCCYSKKTKSPPKEPPSVYKAIRMIAKMGGFLGRKSDGAPGVKVLWRGWRVLENATEMFRIFRKKRCG